MRTSNPVFNSSTYQQPMRYDDLGRMNAELDAAMDKAADRARPQTMSVTRTAWKTLYLVGITAVSAAASWTYFVNNPGAILWASIGALVLGLVSGIVMLKAAKWAGFIVPIFAVGEGAFVAAISVAVIKYSRLSSAFETEAAGYAAVGQAAGLTIGIAAAMLLGYASGLLRLGGIARKVVITLTAGVMIYYAGAFLINLVMGQELIPRLGWDAGPIGIIFSLFVVILASVNLIMDYQFVEDGAKRGLPRHMEWIAAFGILTTLVWLYIEILRLLAKLRR